MPIENDRDETELPLHRRHIWEFQAVRDLLIVLAVFGFFWATWQCRAVVNPMLVALGLAYMVEPLIKKLAELNKHANRTRIVSGFLIGLTALFVFSLVVTLPLAFSQASELIRKRNTYVDSLVKLAHHEAIPEPARSYARTLSGTISEAIKGEPAALDIPSAVTDLNRSTDTTAIPDRPLGRDEIKLLVAEEVLRLQTKQEDKALPSMQDNLAKVSVWLGGVAVSAIDLGMFVFLVGFFFFVFSTSFPAVLEYLEGLIPVVYREQALGLIKQMDRAVSGFVRGRITIAAILALLFGIGWSICGVPHGFVLGLLVGILTIVPYLCGLGLLGAYTLLILKLNTGVEYWLYTVQTAEGLQIVWWKVFLFPGIVFMLAQILDDYILTPTIQGKTTKLSTPAIVACVIAGGAVGGLYGMLLAIPIAACARILTSEVLWPKIDAWIQGRRKDPLPLGQ